MADHSSQNPSAARLQGSGEIVHRDLGPRGHHWHFARNSCTQVPDRSATPRIGPCRRQRRVAEPGRPYAAAAALTSRGRRDHRCAARPDWGSQLQRDPLCRTPGWRTALEPTPAGEAVVGRAERRTIRA